MAEQSDPQQDWQELDATPLAAPPAALDSIPDTELYSFLLIFEAQQRTVLINHCLAGQQPPMNTPPEA